MTSLLRPSPSAEDDGTTCLSLLGGFDLQHDGRPLRLPLSAQRLIAFIALQGRAVQRIYVAGVLWIDSTQDAANASLRTALWRLRRPACRLVDATATQLALASTVTVDVHVTSAAAHRVTRPGAVSTTADDLGRLVFAGELLPDWYDDWVLLERERVRQSRMYALETLCERLSGEGRYGEAVEAGLGAVACEPLRESAHRALVRAHLAQGNRADALRQYELFRRLLVNQLGVEPSPRMAALRELCTSGDGGVTALE